MVSFLLTAMALASTAFALPPVVRDFGPPTTDGFPNPNPQQLLAIEQRADGMAPNGPLPSKVASSTITALQLIAFNENFEVAFFSSLLGNITSKVPGYEDKDGSMAKIIDTILAQEELHALGVIQVLQHYNQFAPMPCRYQFPVTNIDDAIQLAETFTAVVLGTLQDAVQGFAKGGDDAFVRLFASVIGQEGEQNGFYRFLGGAKPSESPFLTTSVASFAWTALQQFVVPGSCPFDLNAIQIPLHAPLMLQNAKVEAKDQVLTFTADLSNVQAAQAYVGKTTCQLFITYFNGQLLPISVPISNIRWNGGLMTFDAPFPFTENIMEGLSIAALTSGNNFASPDDVPAQTWAAPALIQVVDKY